MSEKSVKMLAGTYWLGDPCYVIPDSMWGDWLDAARKTSDDSHDVLDADVPGTGFRAVGLGTKYGDGEYDGSNGHSYGVDAGLIGLVPVGLNPETKYPGGNLCTLETFPDDFTVTWHSDGTLVFGHIVINTGDVLDDDNDYGDSYEDGDDD